MPFIIPFSQLNKNNIAATGGKGANLGEMIAKGLPVPGGFVLTTAAYDAFVKTNGMQQQIIALANTVSADDLQSIEDASQKIRALFMQGDIANNMVHEVRSAYSRLTEAKGNAVAVRSSATAEDLPTASLQGSRTHSSMFRGMMRFWML